jgi:hypothetical protein
VRIYLLDAGDALVGMTCRDPLPVDSVGPVSDTSIAKQFIIQLAGALLMHAECHSNPQAEAIQDWKSHISPKTRRDSKFIHN